MTHPIARTIVLFTALAAAFALPSCGDDAPPPDPAKALLDDYQKRVDAAADNVEAMKDAYDWGRAKLAGDPELAGGDGLRVKLERLGRKLGSSFDVVAGRAAGSASITDLERLADWSRAIIAAEDEKPEANRDPLAAQLASGHRRLLEALVGKKPADPALREELGWQPIPEGLDEFEDAPYLSDDDEADRTKFAQKIAADAATTSDGRKWLPPDWADKAEVDALLERFAEASDDWDEQASTPFGKKAVELLTATAKDMTDTLDASFGWQGFLHEPYVILVERDKSWREYQVADEKANALAELYRTFYEELEKPLDLTKAKGPIPVVLFKRRNAYLRYAKKKDLGAGVDGHFEHATQRLVVHDESDNGTLLHEGTHQLITVNTKRRTSYAERSYWFQEGIAEYFSGAHRYLDEDGNWRYEVGLLQTERLDSWRSREERAYSLWDLIGLTFVDRERNRREEGGVNEDLNLFAYSQGWFLIYFLNNFKVDAEGLVQIGVDGKYKAHWLRYLAAEINGQTGRDTFLASMEISGQDDPKFKQLEEEFLAYKEWVHRKGNLLQVKSKKLIPWNECKHKITGVVIGEREDDLLHKPD